MFPQRFRGLSRQRRLESPLLPPLTGDGARRGPEADRQSRQIGGAQRGRLGHRRPHDRRTEQIGLDLHQCIVHGGAAIDAQLADRDSRIGRHGVEEIGHLKGDALQRRAGEMARGRAARDADDGAARVRIPMRGAEAGKRRDEIDAAVIRNGRGQRFYLGGAAHEPEAVADPLHDGAADENAALECILRLAADAPRDRGDELAL